MPTVPPTPKTSPLVVIKLDRLARSVPDARAIGDDLATRGIRLSLGGQVYDPTDPMGKMFFIKRRRRTAGSNQLRRRGAIGCAAARSPLAEYERTLIAERATAAREAARTRGRQGGQPRAISADQLRAGQAMRAAGESVAALCAALGVKRGTLYAALSEAGDAA